ncbi:hypothetical protein GTW51_08810 [Aurantimonas aggregata]|uniref:DUF1616 domain-containing protein n=1 Tax=Aurantimonas aggregata TaxID=2047720 RepID=A0A6L9MGV3_9HYPH|nr:hypothetical protein [Aurantimonas aggregata]NDV86802.1 hypothetical protein [Aurantimonas aggregata]
MNSSDNRHILAACLWAAATVIAVASSDSSLLRTVLGIPLVLVASGHALLRAAGYRTRSTLEDLVCMAGMSLVAGIAGGFFLHASGLLTPLGWAAWFGTVVVLASIIAARRRSAFGLPEWQWPEGLRARHVTAFLFAALLATIGYALAVRDEAAQKQFEFTELWILPSADGQLSVGLRSGETRTQHFDLEITIDGRPFAIFPSLEVAPGESWTRQVQVPREARPQNAEAKLLKLADLQLYRRVSALVPGS